MSWQFCFLCDFTIVPFRLTGSFVPDLIVSMSHQMWLHLQSDESVGSIGFKINYKGTDFGAGSISHSLSSVPCLWLSFLPRPSVYLRFSVFLVEKILEQAPRLSSWNFRDNLKENVPRQHGFIQPLSLSLPPVPFSALSINPQKLTKRVVVTQVHLCMATKRAVGFWMEMFCALNASLDSSSSGRGW